MRPLSLGIVLVWGLFFNGAVFGQEGPRAVLVDEHGLLACDDSLARLDAFYAALDKNPPAQGLIVISAKPEEKVTTVFRERFIRSYTANRKIDAQRFSIKRARSDAELKVQIWLIPLGAEAPEVSEVDMTYSLSSPTTPFRLAADYLSNDDGICPPSGEFTNLKMFASFLKDNPAARGNIVVRERSLGRAATEGRRLVREFGANGVEQSRVRVFTRTRRGNDYDVPIVEYWFLP